MSLKSRGLYLPSSFLRSQRESKAWGGMQAADGLAFLKLSGGTKKAVGWMRQI